MAKLLRKYNDVFSSGENDIGLTRAVRHEIPLAAVTVQSGKPHGGWGWRKKRR